MLAAGPASRKSENRLLAQHWSHPAKNPRSREKKNKKWYLIIDQVPPNIKYFETVYLKENCSLLVAINRTYLVGPVK